MPARPARPRLLPPPTGVTADGGEQPEAPSIDRGALLRPFSGSPGSAFCQRPDHDAISSEVDVPPETRSWLRFPAATGNRTWDRASPNRLLQPTQNPGTPRTLDPHRPGHFRALPCRCAETARAVSGTAPEFFRLQLTPRRRLLFRPETLSQHCVLRRKKPTQSCSWTPPVASWIAW